MSTERTNEWSTLELMAKNAIPRTAYAATANLSNLDIQKTKPKL
ncbi:hypothetical protein D3OALGB2SA_1368 [Olavius algarvensis associated proteobacterium Delta 3]|nr:hypothetical protein D3OALGB2SA_1368 [Olavius algarvensis associated proteobacterium Delta 3]